MLKRRDYFGYEFRDVSMPLLYKLGAKSNVTLGMYHFTMEGTLIAITSPIDERGQRRTVQVQFRPDEFLEEYHLSNFIENGAKRIPISAIPNDLLAPLQQRIIRLLHNCESWLMDKRGIPYVADGQWGKFIINDTLGRV